MSRGRQAGLIRIRELALILIVGLAANGCAFRQEKAPVAEALSQGASAGYAEIHDKVLATTCLDCHATRFPVLTSYEAVVAAAPAIRKAVVVDRTMPPPRGHPLSERQRAFLGEWIDA